MADDDVESDALADQLRRVSSASNEALRLLNMNLERHNLTEELLHRVRAITDAADRVKRLLVLDALAAGMSIRDTARASGLGPTTVQRWKAER